MKRLIILSFKETLVMDRALLKTGVWKCFHHYYIDAGSSTIAPPINVLISAHFMSLEAKCSNLLEFFKYRISVDFRFVC